MISGCRPTLALILPRDSRRLSRQVRDNLAASLASEFCLVTLPGCDPDLPNTRLDWKGLAMPSLALSLQGTLPGGVIGSTRLQERIEAKLISEGVPLKTFHVVVKWSAYEDPDEARRFTSSLLRLMQ